MADNLLSFPDVATLLQHEKPKNPVYCIFPHIVHECVNEFLNGFPGRVLYAVKANAELHMIKMLSEAGINHFDCASLQEIEKVHVVDPDAKKYFMIPTRLREAARIAQEKYNVRHFVVDHMNGLHQLLREIEPTQSVIFARMAVHHPSAYEDLSVRFGAPPADVPELLKAIRDSGAEPALAFNVGSNVTDPEAYRYAMSITQNVLEDLPFKLRLIDVGGGYPRPYPEIIVPELVEYFDAVKNTFTKLPLADKAEMMGEPGRALVAPSMSAIVEVLLRKDDRLFLNDGMYGAFWMLRIDGPDRFPVRVYRDGQRHDGTEQLFQLNGPTCDSTDTLPGKVLLPADLRAGDYLEFGNIGAYSVSGRTDYNGYYSDQFVKITSINERPPGV